MGVSQSLYKKEASNADRCHLSEAFDFYFSFSKMINESGKRKNDWLRSVESRRVVVDEGRGDFYIYGWTHREKKKKRRHERELNTLTLSAFSFCFSNITSTRKHTRARLPLPPKPKPKPKKQVTSPLSTRI